MRCFKDRSILLQGEGTTALRDAIYQVEAIAREASADGDDVMLVFYYVLKMFLDRR